MRIKEHHHGFTLAEIIMTLFIVGLVATAAVPVFTTKKVTPINADEQTVNTPWKPCTETSGLCTDDNPVVIGCEKISCLDKNNTAYVYENKSDLPSWTHGVASKYSLFDVIDTENKVIKVGSGYLQLMNTNLFFSKVIQQIKGVSLRTDRVAPCHNVVMGNNLFAVSDSSYADVGFESIEDFHNNVVLGNLNKLNHQVQVSTIIGSNNTVGTGLNDPHHGHGNFVFGFENTSKRSFVFGNENGADFGTIVIGRHTDLKENTLYIGPYLEAFKSESGNKLTLRLKEATGGTATSVSHGMVVNGTFTATGAYNISDERLKNVKGAYKKGLKEIKQINPVEFSYKSDKTQSLQVGVVAQDVEKIFPEAVSKMPSGYLAVDSAPMFFASMNALKEVNQKFKEENEKSAKLEKELLALEAELKELTSCKATGFFDRLACLKADFVRFVKSIIVFSGSEVNNEKA